jgi:hypothetical protein
VDLKDAFKKSCPSQIKKHWLQNTAVMDLEQQYEICGVACALKYNELIFS